MKRMNLFLSLLIPILGSAMDGVGDNPAYRRGEIPPAGTYQMGYNPQAAITLENKNWGVDIAATASFLYLNAMESGLGLATSSLLTLNTTGTAYIAAPVSNGTFLYQETKYSPGFQVGIGATFDDWIVSGKYTWISNTSKTTSTAPVPVPSDGDGVWLMSNWFEQLSNADQMISASSVDSNWHLRIDIADIMASQPYYLSPRITAAPFYGIRGIWVRQKLSIGLVIPTNVIPVQSAPKIYAKYTSHNWGIGPRVGIDTSCLLGKGFSLDGRAAGSIIYTRFTRISHSEQVANALSTPETIKSEISNNDLLSPELELGVGASWGMYSHNARYFGKISLMYDFSVLFSQNGMRGLADEINAGTSMNQGGLYLQGLNLQATFEF